MKGFIAGLVIGVCVMTPAMANNSKSIVNELRQINSNIQSMASDVSNIARYMRNMS
ncbi:MAG: hypothetical protein ACRC6V_06650 [Bacteroidales bacterium]